MKNLDSIFCPKKIAVVGASDRKGSVGYGIFYNLNSNFGGKVYPVNPKWEKVQGKKAYPSVKQIPEEIDLGVIAVPASIVPKVVRECGEKGIKGCIVITSGFGETGGEGKKREEEIKKIVDEFNITLVGPNCLGVINTENNLNASFSAQMPKKGNIVILSQSGALGSAIIEWSLKQNIGIKSFVSVGSMLDVDFSDLIQYFGEDSKTGSIVIYMEEIKHGEKFIKAARRFVKKKPIVVLKAGRTEEGKKAAVSHTGALSGEREVYEAVFREVGILSIKETSEMFGCLRALESGNLPKGDRLAIVTNAGGAGVLAVDTIQSEGAEVAELSKETIDELDKKLPSAWSRRNPVDILGDASPETFRVAIEKCIEDKNVDGLLVLFTPQYGSQPKETAQIVAVSSKKYDKPIFSSWVGLYGMDESSQIFSKYNIPNFPTPEEAVRAFIKISAYKKNAELLKEESGGRVVNVGSNREKLSKKSEEGILSELKSKQFLEKYGIPVVQTYFAESSEKAVEKAEKIGFPVIMKIQSPNLTHKTEAGGVIHSLNSKEEVKQAFEKIMGNVKKLHPSALIEGVSVQEMIQNVDYELILGSKRDSNFGPMILFGRGGVEVEIYKDRTLGLLPLNRTMARRIMEDTKIFKFLEQGYKNKKPADIKLLEDVLLKFSYLILDSPEIKEIDINPLAVCDGKPIALDARIIL